MNCVHCLYCKVKKERDTDQYIIYCQKGRWGNAKMKFNHLPAVEEVEKKKGAHAFFTGCPDFEEIG